MPSEEEQRRAVLATEYGGLALAVAARMKTYGVLPPLTFQEQYAFRQRLAWLHCELFGPPTKEAEARAFNALYPDQPQRE